MDVSRQVIVGSVALWLAALPFVTAQRVTVFHSGETLWADAIRLNPDMPRARLNYADAMWKAREDPRAADQLQMARILLPSAPLAPHRQRGYTFLVNVELGSLAMHAGRTDEGQRYYYVAAMTDPTLVKFMQQGPPAP